MDGFFSGLCIGQETQDFFLNLDRLVEFLIFRIAGCQDREGRNASTTSTLEGDINEPLAQLGFSPSREFQWATYSTNRQDMATAWSASQRKNEWIHVAVINDGSSVTLYVDGTPARRDPIHQTPIQGIAMATLPNLNGWNVGASTYNGRAKVFGGGSCIGEVRIVRGAFLAPQDFLLSRRRRA